ncbi:hypothetical protein D480_0217055 [Pseudomonas aeruginosa]|nr:hypothetical protein D480_0217055 [Pseudomonas aeruginosa]
MLAAGGDITLGKLLSTLFHVSISRESFTSRMTPVIWHPSHLIPKVDYPLGRDSYSNPIL